MLEVRVVSAFLRVWFCNNPESQLETCVSTLSEVYIKVKEMLAAACPPSSLSAVARCTFGS